MSANLKMLQLDKAKKAQELVKVEAIELGRCAFTKDRLEKIELFYPELEKAVAFAKQAEKIRDRVSLACKFE